MRLVHYFVVTHIYPKKILNIEKKRIMSAISIFRRLATLHASIPRRCPGGGFLHCNHRSPLLMSSINQSRLFSRAPKRSGRSAGGSGSIAKRDTDNDDPWVAVKDPAGSGRIYWWNQTTNDVTPLDAPKPSATPPPPSSMSSIPAPGNIANANPMMQQPQQPGLMGVMAQGFAFGTGSAVAHSMVGSMFGGGGSHGNSSQSGDDSGGGDSEDFDL
jgi:hypothetical protein